LGIGDWGLGIAQSPIPNPQSPVIVVSYNKFIIIGYIVKKLNNKIRK